MGKVVLSSRHSAVTFIVGVSLLMGSASTAMAQTVTNCGQRVTDGVLAYDIDCSVQNASIFIANHGTLDLAGFTVTGGDSSAIICEGTCTVTGPGTVTGAEYYGIAAYPGRVIVDSVAFTQNDYAGIAATSVTATNCTFEDNRLAGIAVEKRATVTGCEFSLGQTAVHGYDRTRIEVADSVITGTRVGITAGRVSVTGTSILDSSLGGVFAKRAMVSSSTLSGNGTDPGCDALTCPDLGAFRLRAEDVTCDTSAAYGWPDFLPTGETFGVCAND